MTFWLAFVFFALGYLFRRAGERPNPYADVDELAARRRQRDADDRPQMGTWVL